MCILAPLQPPPKIRSSTLVNFDFPIPPLLIHEIIFTISTNTHFFYTSAIFHLPTSCVQPSQRSTPKNIFPTSSIWPIQAAPRDQGARESCEDWHCFNLSLLPQSKDSDNRAHNHWFLIAQAQKNGVLQVVFADQYAFNWNGKPFSPPSLIPSIYNYYFDTLLISSQELTFPWKPVT